MVEVPGRTTDTPETHKQGETGGNELRMERRAMREDPQEGGKKEKSVEVTPGRDEM